MKITEKRFAGRTFNAVQIVPLFWRLKNIGLFVILAVLIIWLTPKMYEKASDGSSFFYILMLPLPLVALFFFSRSVRRVVVYVDPKDKQFVVVRAGLFFNRERINTGISEVKQVRTDTRVAYQKDGESGDSVSKTKTLLVVEAGDRKHTLWTYSKAENARTAANLVEELLKS